MSTHHALLFGVLVGVLMMMTVGMSIAVRFISSDVEGFRKWLDRNDV